MTAVLAFPDPPRCGCGGRDDVQGGVCIDCRSLRMNAEWNAMRAEAEERRAAQDLAMLTGGFGL